MKVWEKTHRLAVEVYEVTTSFPKEEIYGLTSQIRRAAGSVPANIAEGCGRDGDAELARFCQIAMGSASGGVRLCILVFGGVIARVKYNPPLRGKLRDDR